jgi:hypothetical protein
MAKQVEDPLIKALYETPPTATGHGEGRVQFLFGGRPAVLEAIVVARRDRKLSYSQIAKLLSRDKPGVTVSSGSVKNWLEGRGIQ